MTNPIFARVIKTRRDEDLKQVTIDHLTMLLSEATGASPCEVVDAVMAGTPVRHYRVEILQHKLAAYNKALIDLGLLLAYMPESMAREVRHIMKEARK